MENKRCDMTLVFFTAVIVVGMISFGEASSYVPPKQTPEQMAKFKEVFQIAHEASVAATPALLAYIDSPEFRKNISNIPMFDGMAAEDILVILNETLAFSLVTHGLPVVNGTGSLDVTLSQLTKLSFIPNVWERIALGLLTGFSPEEETFDLAMENLAEVKVMGFPNFTSPLNNVSMSEAINRVSYAATDLFQLADGYQFYGPFQIVLNASYIKSISMLSPVDTGGFTLCCYINMTSYPFCNLANCVSNFSFATFYDWNHAFLINAHYWDYQLYQLFQRLFATPEPEEPFRAQLYYFEVDVLGNLIFPEVVSYVIGDFMSLYGTPDGDLLRNWCAESGYPLVWSIAFYINSTSPLSSLSQPPKPQNISFVDVTILNMLPNVTYTSWDTEIIQDAWADVNSTLSENPSWVSNTTYFYSVFNSIYESISDSLEFNILKPNQCADNNGCFGTDGEGHCFCKE